MSTIILKIIHCLVGKDRRKCTKKVRQGNKCYRAMPGKAICIIINLNSNTRPIYSFHYNNVISKVDKL